MLEAEEFAQNQPRRLQLTQGKRPLLDRPGRAIAKRSLMSWAARRPWEGRKRRRSPEIRGRAVARHPFSPLCIRAGARPGSDPESGIGVFGAVSDPGRRLELTSLGLWPAATRPPAAALAAMPTHAGGPKRRNRRRRVAPPAAAAAQGPSAAARGGVCRGEFTYTTVHHRRRRSGVRAGLSLTARRSRFSRCPDAPRCSLQIRASSERRRLHFKERAVDGMRR